MDIELFLENLVKDKDVLEIGGLGDIKRYTKENFINFRSLKLSKIAKSFLSIDINREGIEIVRNAGFDFYYYGNIENFESLPLEIKNSNFDVILLLDVIEHLSNVGLALQNINKLLRKEGLVVISTPNPWAIPKLRRIIVGSEPSEYPEHTCYIVPSHFRELFRRTNFSLKKYFYFTYDAHYSKQAYIKGKFIKFLAKFNKLFHTHVLVLGIKN